MPPSGDSRVNPEIVELSPFDVQECSLRVNWLSGEVDKLLKDGSPYEHSVVYYPSAAISAEGTVVDFGEPVKAEGYGEGSFCSFKLPENEGYLGERNGIGFRLGNAVMPLFVINKPRNQSGQADQDSEGYCRLIYPTHQGTGKASGWGDQAVNTPNGEETIYGIDENTGEAIPLARVIASFVKILHPEYSENRQGKSYYYPAASLYRLIDINSIIEETDLAGDIQQLKAEYPPNRETRGNVDYQQAMKTAQEKFVETYRPKPGEDSKIITINSVTKDRSEVLEREISIELEVDPSGDITILQRRKLKGDTTGTIKKLGELKGGCIEPDKTLKDEEKDRVRELQEIIAEKLGAEVTYFVEKDTKGIKLVNLIAELKETSPGANIHLDFGEDGFSPTENKEALAQEGVFASGRVLGELPYTGNKQSPTPCFYDGVFYCKDENGGYNTCVRTRFAEGSSYDRQVFMYKKGVFMEPKASNRAIRCIDFDDPLSGHLPHENEWISYKIESTLYIGAYRIPTNPKGLRPGAFGLVEPIIYTLRFTDSKGSPIVAHIAGGKVVDTVVWSHKQANPPLHKQLGVRSKDKQAKRAEKAKRKFDDLCHFFGGEENLNRFCDPQITETYPSVDSGLGIADFLLGKRYGDFRFRRPLVAATTAELALATEELFGDHIPGNITAASLATSGIYAALVFWRGARRDPRIRARLEGK